MLQACHSAPHLVLHLSMHSSFNRCIKVRSLLQIMLRNHSISSKLLHLLLFSRTLMVPSLSR